MMQIAVDLPRDFVEMQTAGAIEREMRAAYALALFKAARVTLPKAAELAGLDVYEFMAACKESRIPVIDISKEDLLDELQSVRPA